MATISITSELDVLNKYNALVKESLASDSSYIRAKETIQELFTDGMITTANKAEIISNVIGGLVNSITTASMAAAIDWAKTEKEVDLRKLELALQLDILEQEKLLKEAQVDQTYNALRLAKVESKRLYGAGTFVGNDLASLEADGKVYSEIQLTDAQKLKVDAEKTLTDQKMNESYAAVHKIVADTYVNYGNYVYSGVGATGVTTVTAQHGAYETLSDVQKEIAVEQAKGYTYNAWANALTGSASMLGTAIAAEYAEFGPGTTGETLLNTVLATATNLKNASTTVDEATPV
jgi:hypothetical protein